MSAQHTAGPWIEWTGGDCPVPLGTATFRRYRDGSETSEPVSRKTRYRRRKVWQHLGDAHDIVAYRPARGEQP